jgi:hypothetical protein
MSASTGMKFVSPFQRGTTWRWPWSTIPAPATRPMFQRKDGPQGFDRRHREPLHFERLRVLEVVERRAVPVRRDHEVTGGVRELVEEDEGELATVDHELRLVLRQRRGAAEDALAALVRVLDVLEPPRRPQAFHAEEATSASFRAAL